MLARLHAQVWAVDLVLYKTLPADLNVGEAWMSPASWIQLFGFSLLLAGTIIYAQVPCHDTPTATPKHILTQDQYTLMTIEILCHLEALVPNYHSIHHKRLLKR